MRARLFRAQQTTTNGKRKNDPEHYTQTRQKNSAGDAPSKQEKSTKTVPKSDNKLPTTLSFSSLLPDRRRDRPGDPGSANQHPKSAQRSSKSSPEGPRTPRGGPKWLKMQQPDLEPTPLGPRGVPGDAQAASRGNFGSIMGPFLSLREAIL